MKTTFNLRLPEELCNKIEYEANKNNLSINKYILYTLTKTLYYNEALELVKEKFSKIGNKDVSSILDKIPANPPLEGDEL